MPSTITVVKKHAEMSVKNDASGGVEQISILTCFMPESTQSCDSCVIKAILRLRISPTSILE